MTCKHRWKIAAWSSKDIHEACRCGERRERAPTKTEARQLARYFKEQHRPMGVHKVWDAYGKAMGDLIGYARMEAARKWAEKKGHVRSGAISFATVDDNHFCGSLLVFITHETKREHIGDFKSRRHAPSWMGVTVEYIPQCTGEKPVRFFLYPSDLHSTQIALKALAKRSMAYAGVRREMREA